MEKVGHRGAPRVFPANTLKGFAHARAFGCTMVECDLRQAQDGALVLAHDAYVVDSRTGERFVIAEQASDVLHSLELGAGEGVPLLEELVDWCRETGCAIMADMKCEGGDVEERVVRSLAPLPASQKVVPGAEAESRARFRVLDPSLPLSLSLDRNAFTSALDTFEKTLAMLDTDAVTWQFPLLTPERVTRLRAVRPDIRIFAWTVDDEAVMRRLIALGVDGIISNRADLFASL